MSNNQNKSEPVAAPEQPENGQEENGEEKKKEQEELPPFEVVEGWVTIDFALLCHHW